MTHSALRRSDAPLRNRLHLPARFTSCPHTGMFIMRILTPITRDISGFQSPPDYSGINRLRGRCSDADVLRMESAIVELADAT
ncbi:hypothetical protein [Paraburkholderia pallida]|uniref:hypothetical protein n=1 Tax=Paraburkholderia pallida TaxID=2547399 RepID=UPI001430DB9F|nr:hypothetical protein [Paraburkholderia pallida]